MTDVAEAFAAAEEAALRGSAALEVAMGTVRIYAGPVPENAPLPFVIIGEHQVLEDDAADDDCALGAEIFSTIHVHTLPEAPQNTQARRIVRAVKDALNVALALDGHQVDVHAHEGTQFITDPDQSTHAIVRNRYETTPL